MFSDDPFGIGLIDEAGCRRSVMNRMDAKLEYKLSHPLMGVFQIRNVTNDKVFIGSALNLDGALNSNKFKLNAGAPE